MSRIRNEHMDVLFYVSPNFCLNANAWKLWMWLSERECRATPSSSSSSSYLNTARTEFIFERPNFNFHQISKLTRAGARSSSTRFKTWHGRIGVVISASANNLGTTVVIVSEPFYWLLKIYTRHGKPPATPLKEEECQNGLAPAKLNSYFQCANSANRRI